MPVINTAFQNPYVILKNMFVYRIKTSSGYTEEVYRKTE